MKAAPHLTVLAAVAAMLLPLPAVAECFAWPVESIYDGDTMRATVAGQSTRVRVMGLDTPELPPHSKCESEKQRGYESRGVAEGVGFEPTMGFHPCQFSRLVP
jgi:endonuclease YncB( thermonuclease family)